MDIYHGRHMQYLCSTKKKRIFIERHVIYIMFIFFIYKQGVPQCYVVSERVNEWNDIEHSFLFSTMRVLGWERLDCSVDGLKDLGEVFSSFPCNELEYNDSSIVKSSPHFLLCTKFIQVTQFATSAINSNELKS